MYFQNFPKINLRNGTGATSGVSVAVDILRRAGFSERGKTGSQHFFKYNIKDGETPESLSNSLYGSSNYNWVVLMFNDIIDPLFDWPLSTNKFEKFIKKKYKGVTLYLGEGITGTFKWGDTVALMTTSSGETGWGGVVKEYDPTYRKLVISELGVGENFKTQDHIQAYNSDGGTDWNQYVAGATIERVVSDSTQALHHFGTSGSATAGYDDIGGGTATASMWLDPLSQYNGITQVSLADGAAFVDTLIYGYSFNSTNDYVITNEKYESDLNESKRSIYLLRPEYIPSINDEFKMLIRR